MTRGDRVDRSLPRGFQQLLDVARRPQGWPELVASVVGLDGGVVEREVVRAGIGGHRESLGLDGRDHGGDCAGRHLTEVDSCAGHLDHGEDAHHHAFLGGGRDAWDTQQRRHRALVHVTAGGEGRRRRVYRNHHAQIPGVLERSAQDPVVLDAGVAVGEPTHALRGDFCHRCKLFTRTPDGQRARDQHPTSGVLGDALDVSYDIGVVRHRIGLRRRQHAGVATQDRGVRRVLDGLGFFEPGLPEMSMQIDQPGGHDAPRRIELDIARQRLGELGDPAIDDPNVQSVFTARPEDRAATNDERLRHRLPPRWRRGRRWVRPATGTARPSAQPRRCRPGWSRPRSGARARRPRSRHLGSWARGA